eukprot:6175888-Pleurochrysis_carterae.AAC.1
MSGRALARGLARAPSDSRARALDGAVRSLLSIRLGNSHPSHKRRRGKENGVDSANRAGFGSGAGGTRSAGYTSSLLLL